MTFKNEILEKYQVRKSKKQKEKFREYIKEKAAQLKYDNVKIESGGCVVKNNNIIIGDPDNAELFLTAHYDTCALSPVPNMMFPINIFSFISYQLFVLLYFLFFGFIIMLATAFIFPGSNILLVFDLFILLMAFQMMFGFANKHTANDNTSGVLTLLNIMEKMPEEKRNKVCFVFFDNEEKGMFGSRLFLKNHKKYIDEKLLINFDCIGEGDNLLFAAKKSAFDNVIFKKLIANNEKVNFDKKIIFVKVKSLLFPSDQALFKTSVGVAALKKSKVLGLYASKIHTLKDKTCDEANINVLTTMMIECIKEI